jgi:hypothetical protein
VTWRQIRSIHRLASVAVRENCQSGSPKRRASSSPTQAASSVGSIVVTPADRGRRGRWPAIAPVSPRQKSAYSWPSTSVTLAPSAEAR